MICRPSCVDSISERLTTNMRLILLITTIACVSCDAFKIPRTDGASGSGWNTPKDPVRRDEVPYQVAPPQNKINFTIGINTISFNQGGTPGLSTIAYSLEAAEGSPVQSSGTTSLINNATEKVSDPPFTLFVSILMNRRSSLPQLRCKIAISSHGLRFVICGRST